MTLTLPTWSAGGEWGGQREALVWTKEQHWL